tara:strand:+ start:174 stop:299 length:126 start_codon:yes stop_codon:yes gene_type:complete
LALLIGVVNGRLFYGRLLALLIGVVNGRLLALLIGVVDWHY